MISLRGTMCCGVNEIHGISFYPDDPAESLLEVCDYTSGRDRESNIPRKAVRFDDEAPFLIFTQACDVPDEESYGNRLAALIEKEGLGTVVASESALNPNSDNYVTVFTWAVDWDALETWYNACIKPKRRTPVRRKKLR